ncbi:hypothetical protein PUN28_017649 [Cardiocondyla obscurior]|uniref:Uncharacterized protein n=1 Tax=Cardiocondyla obscurior TaxID=286306 RepID=A0AAW2EKQ5_9HYME
MSANATRAYDVAFKPSAASSSRITVPLPDGKRVLIRSDFLSSPFHLRKYVQVPPTTLPTWQQTYARRSISGAEGDDPVEDNDDHDEDDENDVGVAIFLIL